MAEGNASPVGEDRNAWLRRWESQNQPLWKALTPEEYEAIAAHVRGQERRSAHFTQAGWTPGGRRENLTPRRKDANRQRLNRKITKVTKTEFQSLIIREVCRDQSTVGSTFPPLPPLSPVKNFSAALDFGVTAS